MAAIIGVGDGRQRALAPKIGEKYFSGKNCKIRAF